MNDRSNDNDALPERGSTYDGNRNKRAGQTSNEWEYDRSTSVETNTSKGYNYNDDDQKIIANNENRKKPPPLYSEDTTTMSQQVTAHAGRIDSKQRDRESRLSMVMGGLNVVARSAAKPNSNSTVATTTTTKSAGDGINTTDGKNQERERNRQLLSAKIVQRKPAPARSGSYASSGSSSYYTDSTDDDVKPSSLPRNNGMKVGGEVDTMFAAKSRERAQSVASLTSAKPRAKISTRLFKNRNKTPNDSNESSRKQPPLSNERGSYVASEYPSEEFQPDRRPSANLDRETGVDAMTQSKQQERQRSMEALMGSNVIKRRPAYKSAPVDPIGRNYDQDDPLRPQDAQLNEFSLATANNGSVQQQTLHEQEKEQQRRILRKDTERNRSRRSLETIEEDDMKPSATNATQAGRNIILSPSSSSTVASIDQPPPSSGDRVDEMMLSKIRERENRLRSMNQQQQRKPPPDERNATRAQTNIVTNADPRERPPSRNIAIPTDTNETPGNNDIGTNTSIHSMMQRRQQILSTTCPDVDLKYTSSYGTKTDASPGAHDNDETGSFDYCLAVARSQSRNVSQSLRDRINRERAKLGEMNDSPTRSIPSNANNNPSRNRSSSTDSDESNDILTLLKQTQALDHRGYSTNIQPGPRESTLDQGINSNDGLVDDVRPDIESTAINHDRFEHVDDTIEAQADSPILYPGAFAIEGVGARDDDDSTDSGYDSVFNDQSRASQYRSHDSLDDPLEDNSPFANGDETVDDDGVLAAELHDELVVDGAVIQPHDDDDIILDMKTVRRLRQVQVSVICFCLAAIAVVSISVMGGFQKYPNASDIDPFVEGWQPVGLETFGQSEMAQTLFGYRIALSGNGTRIAVVSPGYDNGSVLNVGKLYIMEEAAGPNGTEWALLDAKDGVHSSKLPHMSLATSTDFGTVAIGYPHIQGGGQVQTFRESDGSGMWITDPIPLNSTTSDETWYGYSVDLSADGSLLAVGDPLQNTAAIRKAGALYVYTKNRSTLSGWSQLGQTIFGKKDSEYVGWSVKIVRADNVTRLFVGAPIANDTTGLVRIYELVGSKWKQIGDDYVGQEPFQRFGESISASGDGRTFAVGARGTAFSSGNVQIYSLDSKGSTSSNEKIIMGSEPGESFGSSISLSEDGKVLVVGAPQNNLYDRGTGIIRVYHLDETSSSQWIEQGSNIGSTTMQDFGTSVSMSTDGNRIVGGAPSTSFAESVPLVGCFQVYTMEQTSAV